MINKLDFASRLSDALDLLSPKVVSHHKHVAYIAIKMAQQLKLSRPDLHDVAVAALLHDCGAISCKEKELIMNFHQQLISEHAYRGYRLLNVFSPFADAAEMVKYHHVSWSNKNEIENDNITIPMGSEIIFLADRVDSLVKNDQNILEQKQAIRDKITKYTGDMFAPYITDAFMRASESEAFWLDYRYCPHLILTDQSLFPKVSQVSRDELLEMAKMYCRVIDFRSPFTASHSIGLSCIASTIAQLLHFPPNKVKEMKIAGYLHDLGKLAVSKEILEKPGKLDAQEMNIMRMHTFFTYRILEKYPNLNEINRWASYHHERLDGTGYPFRINKDDLHLGSRIMAVADVFTAITEDRPYRRGMTKDKALHVLNKMARDGALDNYIVDIVNSDFDDIDEIRHFNQIKAFAEHKQFLALEGETLTATEEMDQQGLTNASEKITLS